MRKAIGTLASLLLLTLPAVAGKHKIEEYSHVGEVLSIYTPPYHTVSQGGSSVTCTERSERETSCSSSSLMQVPSTEITVKLEDGTVWKATHCIRLINCQNVEGVLFGKTELPAKFTYRIQKEKWGAGKWIYVLKTRSDEKGVEQIGEDDYMLGKVNQENKPKWEAK
jgi:hypothetical protein